MNHEIGEPSQHIQELYWDVSCVDLRDVVDQVRTTLTVLVAELLATMPDDQALPSPAVAEQAVNVAVYGARPIVNMQTAQAASGGHTNCCRYPRSAAVSRAGLLLVADAQRCGSTDRIGSSRERLRATRRLTSAKDRNLK